jgi:LuxR family maltose regulon positive regulatory protein
MARRAGSTGSANGAIHAPALPLLVDARFKRPVLRPSVIVRTRVRAVFDRWADRKVLLVAAPTGFGKTTAVAAWLEGPEPVVAWLSLEPGEDHDRRLATYIVAAIHQVLPGVGSGALAALQNAGVDIGTEVIGSLTNDIDRSGRAVTLVLDDYHVIRDPACHALLAELIADLPDRMRLVIVTRSDPPIPLGRLRASGQLGEIRQEDLRFEADEVRRFVEAALGEPLDQAEVEALVERTEGWPAALSLAALSLTTQLDPRAFIRSYTGASRHVVEYLTSEVLDAQSPDMRAWLLQSSALSVINGGLADAVTGTTGGTRRLVALARSNGFVSALDERGGWFRFHRMFREAIGTVLDQELPGARARILSAAAAWHEANGLLDQAIRYALLAGDHDLAGRWIARHYITFIRGGHLEELRQLIESLDAERLAASRGAVAFVAALAASLAAEPAEVVDTQLERVERFGFGTAPPDGFVSPLDGVLFVRASFPYGDVNRQASAGVRLLAEQPDDRYLEGAGRLAVGHAAYLRGEFKKARAALAPFGTAVDPRRPFLSIFAISTRALVELDTGDLDTAGPAARAAHDASSELGMRDAVATAIAHEAYGAVLLAEGKVAAARSCLEHAARLTRPTQPLLRSSTLLALAAARSADGDLDGAIASTAEARDLIEGVRDPGALPARLRRVERAIRRGGADTTRREPPTSAELRVLRLLPSSLSQREIADELYLSPDTVKTHVRRLYRKLDAASRSEAVDRARMVGLL